MFISDDLTYIQMQKSASSHIASLLPHFFEGQQIGKHNTASPEQVARGGYFVSSIRNPWDWYLSLWTFGIKGNGGFRTRLIKGASLKRLFNKPTPGHYMKLQRDAKTFRALYSDNSDVEAFREWIRRIYDPETRYLYKPAHQALATLCGPMTFRYLNLCCQNMEDIPRLQALSSYQDLVQFDRDNGYIDYFIRQESLEDDFCEAIEKVRPLTSEEKERVYSAQKTNTSERSKTLADYYDEETIELVRTWDRFLIEKFDYSFPRL